MTLICLHPIVPTRQAPPLALVFTSRRLLTEKSSVTANTHSLAVRTETHTLRATMLTATLNGIPGFNRPVIND